jgi:hypothetical protein
MPTAVEYAVMLALIDAICTAAIEQLGADMQGLFEARSVPGDAARSLVGRGGGTAIGEGRTLYRKTCSAGGKTWDLCVIGMNKSVLTSWLDTGKSARPKLASGGSSSNPRLQFTGPGGRQYHKVSNGPIAYSIQLEPLVIADYGSDGAVRGIDFVGRMTKPFAAYLAEARAASRGPEV